jgi:hypothetical protein
MKGPVKVVEAESELVFDLAAFLVLSQNWQALQELARKPDQKPE